MPEPPGTDDRRVHEGLAVGRSAADPRDAPEPDGHGHPHRPFPPLVTIEAAAQLLAVPKTTVYRLVRDERAIAAAKEGRRWVVSTADVYRYAADRIRQAGHDDAADRTADSMRCPNCEHSDRAPSRDATREEPR